MSDDENYEASEEAPQEEEPEPEPEPIPETPKTPTLKKPPVEVQEGGKSEAELLMEEKKKKDLAKQEAELAEYYEMRKEEKERIDAEISELKEKRALRLKEREEEEQRLNEMRQQEEHKRRAEEAERQRKKQEEIEKKRAERDAKRREAEDRAKNLGKRNFAITRKNKSGEVEMVGGGDAAKGPESKTKEQLEAEKKAILEQRIAPLGDVNGLDEEGLKQKAKELQQHLLRLESDKYDLEQTFKQRQYEMNELADRARAMNKAGKKKTTTSTEADPLAEKFSGIPPKLQLCSKYERHTDRRTYVERKDVFTGPNYAEETPRILPKSELEGGEEVEAEA